WSLVASPAGMAINANTGAITWMPTEAQANTGDHLIRVRLTDAAGGSDTGQFTVHAWRTILTTHFRTRWWAPDGNVAQAYAQTVSDYMENSWTVQVTNYTYRQPPNMAGNRIDVWVDDIPAAGTYGLTYNATATNPPSIEIDIGRSEDIRKDTAAHEFFHAIQCAYKWFTNNNELWWMEATAVYMADEVYDNVNTVYLMQISSADSLLRKPTTHMYNVWQYSGCLLPIALSEVKNDALIKDAWEEVRGGAVDCVAAITTKLGGADKWRSFWEDFGIMNYDVKRYTEGASFTLKAALGKDYAAANDEHYIYKQGTAYPPSPSLGIKIDHNTFQKFEGSVPGLATYYLRFQVPDQVRNGNTRDTELFLYFDGDDAVVWNVAAYGVMNDGVTVSLYRRSLLDPNNNNANRTGSVHLAVGGNGPVDYKEVIIVIGNSDTNNTARAFKISGALVPVFQGLYAPNADTGTTKTVKNLGPDGDANNEGPDEDNIYKNGDTIEIEVDLSDIIQKGATTPIPRANRSFRTDFTAIDSNATPLRAGGREIFEATGQDDITAQLEEVTLYDPVTLKYKVKYTISASNAHDGKRVENIPVKLELQDLSLQDNNFINKDETFKVIIDNEPPKVERVIVTQGSKTIYDSQGGVSEWAKAGTIQVKVIFNESMQTDEINGTDVDATIKFDLNAPYTAHTVTRSGGWSTTTKKNDTWTGQFVIPNGQGLQYDGKNTLSITARDQAGNWLDSASRQIEAATPDTSHTFKIDTTRPTVSVSTDFVGSQECPDINARATAKDELDGSTDPNKVSGLKEIRYIVTPPGGWKTINNPNNPHSWHLATIPAKQSVTYQIIAEDNAGNITNTGSGIDNNFPGCDKPDENLSVSSLFQVMFNDPTPNRRVDPAIAVLNNGFAPMTQAFLEQLGEPSTLVEFDFSPAMVDDYPVLVIPSGGLYGIDSSTLFRVRLRDYADNGGTIVVFDQQHGYEYRALPGSRVDGYGWVEDNSCFNASLYISEYHQVLSGFKRSSLTSKIDGYFTTYPEGTITPLNRTKNGMPGLLMYSYGNGWVVATTIYDDFGLFNRQSSSDSHVLIRDLISWAIHPEEMPEYDPGEPVTLPVTLTNASNVDATSARLYLLDPDRHVVDQQDVVVSVPAGGQVVVDFSTTAGNKLGIWWVDYELLGSTVQDQVRGARFVVSNPPPSSGPGKELGLTITAPSEHFIDGSTGRFTFHVFNFTDQEKEVEVRYGFPHHTWETRNNSYGNFSDLHQTLTVPPATVVRDISSIPDSSRVVNGMLPGEATFVHTAIMRTTDRLFGYLYFNSREVDQNWFKIWEAPASVNVNVTPNKLEYTRGESGSAEILLTNLSQATCTVTVDIRARDNQNELFHYETQTATLNSQQVISLTTNFIVSATAGSGIATLEAVVKDQNNVTVGSGTVGFNIPPSPLFFYPTLPELMNPGELADLSILAVNASPLYPVAGASLAVVLLNPQGNVAADLGAQVFDLAANADTSWVYSFTAPDPIFGNWRFRFTAVDAFGVRTWDETIASQVSLDMRFDESFYRVRTEMGVMATVRNNGSFGEMLTVTVGSPVLPGSAFSQTVSIDPGQSTVVTGSLMLPGDLVAGAHPIVITAQQASGGFYSKSSNFSIAESLLVAVNPPEGRSPSGEIVQAGHPFTFTINNTGGADTTATYDLEIVDSRGNTMHTDSGVTGNIMAGSGIDVNSTLPDGLVEGRYSLVIGLTDDKTGRQKKVHFLMSIEGLSAEMSNQTNVNLYLQIDPITATIRITNTDGAITNSLLTVQVIGSEVDRSNGTSRIQIERSPLPKRLLTDEEKSTDNSQASRMQDENDSRIILNGNPVLVIQDKLSWGYDSLHIVLEENYIAYDQVGSDQIPTIDMNRYRLVIIPSDQTLSFNTRFNDNLGKFEAYAQSGGILVVHTANYSSDYPIIQGPGGVLVSWQPSNNNYVAMPEHPMAQGVDPIFSGNYASHNIIQNLPPDANVICTLGSGPGGPATLVEYPLGIGWVILSGQTLEWLYGNGYQGGIILQNEIPYAYDLDLGQVYWEWQTPVSLDAGQYTTIITPVVPMTATGKLYLRSWLDTAQDQQLARADNYPFYVFPGLTFLTVGADRDFYARGQSMDIGGLVRNARTDGRAADQLDLTGYLTVTLNNETVYTEGPLTIPPGSSYTYALTTGAPGDTGSVTLVAIVDDITGTVRMTDTVQVVDPQVEAAIRFPEMVGQAPFQGEIELANTGLLPAVVNYLIISSDSRSMQIPPYSGQVSLDVGESVILKHEYQIVADTTFTIFFDGDLYDSLSADVEFGEDAEAIFNPPSKAKPGSVEIPYEMINTGKLDTTFTTYVTVTQQTDAGRAAYDQIVATRVITAYLTSPELGRNPDDGQSDSGYLTGTLMIDLETGDYLLEYKNLFECGEIDFSVLGANQLFVRPVNGSVSGGSLPFTSTVINVGYNHFTGTLRVDVIALDNETRAAASPWASDEAPFSVEPGGSAGEKVIVGLGTYAGLTYPFYNFYENNRTQMLYLGSEIGSSGRIAKLAFDIAHFTNDPNYRTMRDFTIRLKTTTEINWNSVWDYADMAGAVTVYGPVDETLPGSTGWVEFDIEPFDYHDDENLIVEVVWGDNGDYTSDEYYVYSTYTNDYMVNYGFADSETPPAFDNKSSYRPNLRLTIEVWPEAGDVPQEMEGQTTVALDVNTATAVPGRQQATFQALDPQGKPVSSETKTFTLDGPDYHIAAFPDAAQTQLTVGRNATMTFEVENQGLLSGEASLTFKLGDVGGQTQKAILGAGESVQIDFVFYVDDDLASGRYLATYVLTGTHDAVGEWGDLMATVQGIDVEAVSRMDQPFYREGDPAQMVMTVTNGIERATPNLYALASFEGYTQTRPFQLAAGQSVTMTFNLTATFGGDDRISYGVYNQATDRAVLLDTLYIRQAQGDVSLITDRDVYQPGDLVQVTVVTTATGTLHVEAPGFTDDIPLGGADTAFSFSLPALMTRGSYAIYHTLLDCGCAGEGEQKTHDIDVRSTEIRVTEVVLDETSFDVGETVTATLTIASNEEIELTLESWLRYPDGSEGAPITQTIHLDDILNNHVTVSQVIVSSQLGEHSLIYRIYGPGNGLYGSRGILNAGETVYASGGETFDVGSAALTALTTDKDEYPNDGEPAEVTMEVYSQGEANGSLALLLDGQPVWNEAVALTSGFRSYSFTLMTGLTPGWRTLTATLEVEGATSQREHQFAYGTQSADLTVSDPWLADAAAGRAAVDKVIAALVTNQGAIASGATT
ncbi:MAG: hypothetical protein JXA42_02670, partial [Anaerolineales bacterium]|nr:hypothetical protein [Anaerolineales bacterium]